MKERRLVIVATGWRDAGEEWRPVVFRALAGVGDGYDRVVVIHGDCRGIDTLVDQEAKRLGYLPIPYPYIGKLGVAGGPARNADMVADAVAKRDRYGYDAVCLAFHRDLETSRGTLDCYRRALRAGLDPTLFELDSRWWPAEPAEEDEGVSS